MHAKEALSLLKDTFKEWNEDNVPLYAAALAYYTIFSLAPVMLIAIAIAGVFFGEEAARGEIVNQVRGVVGSSGGEAIQSMLQNARQPGSGGAVATLIGAGTLLLGATGVFAQLQLALNKIWNVEPKPEAALWDFLQKRLFSFAMVLVIGFLLLMSLVLSAALSGFGKVYGDHIPGYVFVGHFADFALFFFVITLLFAAIYKILPDVTVPWKDLWIGAAVTALFFNIGKLLIGWYLGSSSAGSAYGAAGSFVVLLIWVFYSAQIMLFGAEFTQVYARRRGTKIEAEKHATELRVPEGAALVDDRG